MDAFRWWLTLELYLAAVVADIAGHSNLAIVVAVVATIGLLAALELAADRELDDEHGLTIERLAIVLIYAWQHHNTYTAAAHRKYVGYCRRRALGIGSW